MIVPNLLVQDMSRSVAFYRDLLGMDVAMSVDAERGYSERELSETARTVLSYHDFERCPPLAAVVARLRKHPADIYKIAVTGSKPTDNMKLLQLLDDEDMPPLVTLAMDEVGAPSRILAPSRA